MSKKLVLLPSTMAEAGWRAVRARPDVEAVAFEANLPKTEFHAAPRNSKPHPIFESWLATALDMTRWMCPRSQAHASR